VIAVLEGDAKEMLRMERTILNFLQHMCGVATAAQAYVRKCVRFPVLVCPTRKTPWGLLDKRACVVGGAGTHRLNLSDAVLVKDTHLDLLEHDYRMLADKLAAAQNLGRFVEIEVESMAEGRKASRILAALQKERSIPCLIMLDNMKPDDIRKFVKELRSSKSWRNILIEASGGISLKNIKEYARTGVDVVSVGAMTHSAQALDISFKIVL
jgi:nicotinate-nucleotide pyrophosphorylase (carboxylating)